MEVVGVISSYIESLINIPIAEDRKIYIGPSNIAHMQSSHPNDYVKYKDELLNILSSPDYVGVNPRDNSIEFVKEFQLEDEYVKVAIRVSDNKRYYARSLYVLNYNRVQNFIVKGTLKKT